MELVKMIFNEIYSVYYKSVALILNYIINGGKSIDEIEKIVNDNAFKESFLTIIPALEDEKWQLVNSSFKTRIKNSPNIPLTLLEKRWLKAISLDKRVKLFDIDFSFLEDVEPLFTEDDYYIYDKYGDGDPYSDENYINTFKVLLKAIKNETCVKIRTLSRKGNDIFVKCYPEKLEYSEKDDKFRVIISGSRFMDTINISRIISCKECDNSFLVKEYRYLDKKTYNEMSLMITDERNALERCMLHFAHFEKQVERVSEDKYLAKIKYRKDDEAELVIRVLAFGPLIEVIEPKEFRDLIKEKLIKQMNCNII